jgi:putative glutamine amidotransferase
MNVAFPLIGIPCEAGTDRTHFRNPINSQNSSYVQAVIEAGGLPILIPIQVAGERLSALFDRLDGILFPGGDDIDPARYRQTPQVPNLGCSPPEQDELELTLMQMAIEHGKPFLGICRGIQVMNVASGGTLWQDIATQYPPAIHHDYYSPQDPPYPRSYLAHEVSIEPASRLHEMLGVERLSVNSLHHQGVREFPSTLRAVGQAEDGLVEALEAVGHPFGIGVQWHPEELVAEQETARRLFAAFVAACRGEGQ